MSEVISQLNQAKSLALSNRDAYPAVLRQTLRLVNNTRDVQRWLSDFYRLSFTSDELKLKRSAKVDIALDALDSLLVLVEVPDLEIFNNVIETSVVIFKLVFQYVSENDNCDDYWNKLNALTTALVGKFSSSFPFPADNEEHDLSRSLKSKLLLVNFIVVLIDYKLKSVNIPNSSSSKGLPFSLANVPPNHALINPQAQEAEAFAYFDILLKIFQIDILVAPLITALLNHFAVIAKRKPRLMAKFFPILETFDTRVKLQLNYELLEEFKLSKKYVDRSFRVFINFILRHQLVPSNLQSSLNRKLQSLIQRGDEIRKRNILLPQPEDSQIKKRKFDGFANPARKLSTTDYKNLYMLTDTSEELNSTDLLTMLPNALIGMVLVALTKVSSEKLAKGLGIIADRYKHTVATVSVTPEPNSKSENDRNGDDDDDDKLYNPASVFTLPPPQDLSFDEKKHHLQLIIKNFFKMAEKPPMDGQEPVAANLLVENLGVDSQLTKIAIESWKKDSWVIILSRLATRGMRTVDTEKSVDQQEANKESDIAKNDELSDLVRKSLFDYFLENIHGRIDVIIEWLSEEWYSEKVLNEEKLIRELTEKYMEDGDVNAADIDSKVAEEVTKMEIPTPHYNLWAGKVLDAMIPFLEPNDRKVFIRLLSDLPYLNAELVQRIKSLCIDPGRLRIGFLSLQFLIMYRPPVKQVCLELLEELSKSDQDDLKEESLKLYEKYK